MITDPDLPAEREMDSGDDVRAVDISQTNADNLSLASNIDAEHVVATIRSRKYDRVSRFYRPLHDSARDCRVLVVAMARVKNGK